MTITWFFRDSVHTIQSVWFEKEIVSMFGLPTFTTVVILGVPTLWIIYTVVFMWLSRGWKREDVEETP
jgi:hypothetical protein